MIDWLNPSDDILEARRIGYEEGVNAGYEVAGSLHAEIDRLREDMATAWGLIANAFEGDWSKAPATWKVAAERWRDTACHRIATEGSPQQANPRDAGV
jgi:hypothetical protein